MAGFGDFLAYMGAGLAEGAGTGLLKDADARRERALEVLRQDNRKEMAGIESANRIKEGEVADNRRNKLGMSRDTHQSGLRKGETRLQFDLTGDRDKDLNKLRQETLRLENQLGIKRDDHRSENDLTARLTVLEQQAEDTQDRDLLNHVRKLKEIAATGAEARKTAVTKAQNPTPKPQDAELTRNRAVQTAVKLATSKKDGVDWIDWEKAAKYLETRKMPEIAAIARENAAGNYDPELWRVARQRAEAEASEKAGWWTSESDFPEDKGSKEAFVTRRAMELYPTLRKGGGAAGQPQTQPNTGTPAPTTNAAPVAGGGTQADPYKATTQGHVDWFKNSAPSGAVIEINGKLYKKP
ncbi:MAG: hypothetical protein VW405_04775 [Rhodospirillaceae bacterium]